MQFKNLAQLVRLDDQLLGKVLKYPKNTLIKTTKEKRLHIELLSYLFIYTFC